LHNDQSRIGWCLSQQLGIQIRHAQRLITLR
jgi:hypothetical protein